METKIEKIGKVCLPEISPVWTVAKDFNATYWYSGEVDGENFILDIEDVMQEDEAMEQALDAEALCLGWREVRFLRVSYG